ncbi:MAG: ATP synthase F1 subunit gamma [Candidatus Omnitrophica bacterium]|nr:ATP synthase F1 subunit gamma [Candidatus Omnitrophota bacterium]
MSGQLRTLRNRIRSVENTKKITRAMEMVAAAKLRRFQDMMQKSRAYTEGLETLLKRLSGGAFADLHPFIQPREEKNVALVLMTSDTGLCGSYNNDLANMALAFIRRRQKKPVTISVGKAGATALKTMGCAAEHTYTDIRASRVEEILAELRKNLAELYLSGKVDSIYVIYSHFKTLITFKAITEKLLPLERPADSTAPAKSETTKQPSEIASLTSFARNDDAKAEEYIFEPSPEIVFQKLVPQFFDAKVRMIFLEAIVSEQIARMTAMHQATKNAKEMIDALVIKRNKARQASITKELIEIVSGSKALKIK